jgi:hypothetical protein
MRKPGDPDYEEDEGETADDRETSTRREPVMSDPEPPPRSARPEEVAYPRQSAQVATRCMGRSKQKRRHSWSLELASGVFSACK